MGQSIDRSEELAAFGARLRSVRRAYAEAVDHPDMTAVEFARRVNIPTVAYQSYEDGQADPPLATLVALHRRTGVSLDWLIAYAEDDDKIPRLSAPGDR